MYFAASDKSKQSHFWQDLEIPCVINPISEQTLGAVKGFGSAFQAIKYVLLSWSSGTTRKLRNLVLDMSHPFTTKNIFCLCTKFFTLLIYILPISCTSYQC